MESAEIEESAADERTPHLSSVTTGPSARTAPRTLVIVPAFNEASTIGPTLVALRDCLGPIEVLVVDDGSDDATGTAGEAEGATVARLPFNLGIGGALRTGFRYAVEHGYDRAVQFDADGQHDPRSIPALLDGLDEGADLVIGNRFGDAADHPTQPYDAGRVRAGAMALLRTVVRQVSGHHVIDTSSGYRAFSRPMLEFFATEYPAEYLESVEALLLATSRGFRVAEVPVVMHERAGGRPSQHRVKLVYHFFRLLVVLAAGSSGRRATRAAEEGDQPATPSDEVST
ncbi:MAG: glycosyltransferase family 2 protein [Acidimicrobiia bacterium]|nr:glycosyltransferase family 2 protein [Acidimicrobiia bacterium]